MTTTPHGQVPEALRLAEEISNLVCSKAAAKTIAAAADELCRQHDENETLRAGYAAARLEIESLKAQLAERAKEHADELAVAYMCGASREKELAAQQPDAAYAAPQFPDHPEPMVMDWSAIEISVIAQYGRDMYEAGKRASHGQAPAGATEPTEVPYQKLTNEIDLILSDPDTELSIGAKRALLWMRTWVSVPLYTAPQPAPAPLSDDTALLDGLARLNWYVGPGDFYCDEAGGMNDYDDKNSSPEELRQAIRAAIAAQGGK